jgi:hypothetical protein
VGTSRRPTDDSRRAALKPRADRHLPAVRRARWLLAAAVALGSAGAFAQDIAVAEALFNRGLGDMEAGRYDTGCKALAESQRLDPRPGTLFTLATCEARWGHAATAVTRYRDYLAVYEALPPDRKAQQGQRPKLAKTELEKLAQEVAQLTLTLPASSPPGTVVKRDGEVVAEAALGLALPADPGEHTLSTQAPDGPIWQQRITLGKGESKTVTLVVESAAGPAVSSGAPGPAPTADAGPSGRRVATYVIGGAGLGAGVAGGILGGLAIGAKGTVDQHCGAGIGASDETACDRTGLDAANSAKGLSLGSTIALAAGVAAVGASAVLFFTEPRPVKGAAAQHRWIAAGVLSVGPGFAGAGIQGAW